MVIKKSKKRAANKTKRQDPVQKSTLIIENTEELKYAKVIKKLGNGRYTLNTPDNVEYIGRIRGSIRKFTRIEVGDVVMISLREFDQQKVDICHKYSNDDVKFLERKEHIQWVVDTNSTAMAGIVFATEEKEEEKGEEINFDDI